MILKPRWWNLRCGGYLNRSRSRPGHFPMHTMNDYTWTNVAMLAVGMSPLLLCVLLFFAALVRIQWTE